MSDGAPIVYEDACDDGGCCEWVCEERYDEKGALESWDNFCSKCGRWQDYAKTTLDQKPAESATEVSCGPSS